MVGISNNLVAGVDEAGRGPLAGPVVAAAVILNPAATIIGLKDSKLLSAKQRSKLFIEIYRSALAVGVGVCSSLKIDQINILQATLLAMHQSVINMNIMPDHILVDGNILPQWHFTATAIIKGDQLEPAIAAASIIAKVTRDNLMIDLGKIYPNYGFAQHKGYGTKYHIRAIEKYGKTPEHRQSFLRNIKFPVAI